MMVVKFHFHSTPTITGKLIRFWTGSKVNHVSVQVGPYYYDTNYGQKLKCRTRPVSKAVETYSFEISDLGDRLRVSNYINSSIGTKYDYLALVGFLVNKRKENKRRLYCSEFAANVLSLFLPNSIKHRRLLSPESLRVALEYMSSDGPTITNER